MTLARAHFILRINPNGPCPCGNGETYAKCHMPLEQIADEVKMMIPQLDRLPCVPLRMDRDMDGVVLCYMDGSPQDVLGPNADRGFHTIVIVLGVNQSVELQQEEAAVPFFSDFALQKSEDPNDEVAYRLRIAEALGRPGTHRRIQIIALSYDEADAMAAKGELLRQCYGDGDYSQFYAERQNHQNSKWTSAFPSFFINGRVAEGKINAILPLFIISEFIASIHKKSEEMCRLLRQAYAGLFVISDKLCGDGLGATPKADIVNAILQSWYQDHIRVRNYDHRPKRCGELLADNISGLLNACARDPNHPGWNTARQMNAGRCLHWQKMNANGRFVPMAE
jgi:hypothetical protein